MATEITFLSPQALQQKIIEETTAQPYVMQVLAACKHALNCQYRKGGDKVKVFLGQNLQPTEVNAVKAALAEWHVSFYRSVWVLRPQAFLLILDYDPTACQGEDF